MNTYSLHTDLYQINMAYAYYKDNVHEKTAVFEVFFRKNPLKGSYAVFAGLERIVEVINNFRFSESDIKYLESFNYSNDFLDYLSNFRFSGNIRSVREGEFVFANEPILIVEGTLLECQLIETAILNVINFQTQIATKATRIKHMAKNKQLFEFGARRAHEIDAAIWGARAAYLAGFDGTSLLTAGEKFNIPVVGTHSHAFVQCYPDEYTAFIKYGEVHENVVFLIDTYDTLKSGIFNAIRAADTLGDKINFKGVRIDSGDLAYNSKEVRRILDEHGYYDTIIIASNDLDESTIASLTLEGAKIDAYGVGTKLITSYTQPALGAVYKLVNIDNTDVIKLSNNIEKISTPGKKNVYRIINSQGKSEGDYITLSNESVNTSIPLKMFSESNPLMFKVITDYKLYNIHINVYENGKLVYDLPTIEEIRNFHNDAKSRIWDEHLRYKNPAAYYVDLSEKCYSNKQEIIKKFK